MIQLDGVGLGEGVAGRGEQHRRDDGDPEPLGRAAPERRHEDVEEVEEEEQTVRAAAQRHQQRVPRRVDPVRGALRQRQATRVHRDIDGGAVQHIQRKRRVCESDMPIGPGGIDVDDDQRSQREDQAQKGDAAAIHRTAGDGDGIGFSLACVRRGKRPGFFFDLRGLRGRHRLDLGAEAIRLGLFHNLDSSRVLTHRVFSQCTSRERTAGPAERTSDGFKFLCCRERHSIARGCAHEHKNEQ